MVLKARKNLTAHTQKTSEKKSRSASKESTRLAQDTKKYTDTATGKGLIYPYYECYSTGFRGLGTQPPDT